MEFLLGKLSPLRSFGRQSLSQSKRSRINPALKGVTFAVGIQLDELTPSGQPVMASQSIEADDDFSDGAPQESRKRSKKRRIYCFNCNRPEFHIMAYKGTWLHSFLVGMSFGLAKIFGPYRCTCCGRKRAMFADFCSLSYHWRKWNESRLSRTSRRRKRSRRR